MKAISLWQPWASLWLSPAKVHETRHWATPYRGQLAVHAAQHLEKDISGPLIDIVVKYFGANWVKELPRGAVLGKLALLDCKSTNYIDGLEEEDSWCGDFDYGRFAWKRGPYQKLLTPVPFKGRQAFFSVPDDLFNQPLCAAEL